MMNKCIEVNLPKDAEGMVLYYEKVAERDSFEEEEASDLLQQNVTYSKSVNAGNEDLVKLMDLEDGIYQIYISGDEEYEFAPMLVSVPAWNEKEEQMLYEVSVTPKYTKYTETPILESPKTGDSSNGSIFGVFGVISFIIVVIMSCHNRFKCARMTE